jgi:HAD superfamily hydrolase (TIGR01509 family)
VSVLELVIFDCDGVLVDSELIACGTVSACLKDIGIDLPTAEVIESFAGLSSSRMIEDFAVRYGLRLPPDFMGTLQGRTRDSFDRDLKPIDGVNEVLGTIPYRKCVASSGSPEKILHSLELTGLLKYFDGNLFSATQVRHGKPAPDLFLFAAGRMRVPAKHCVVIEDSVPGVQAACAAEMRVLGFLGGSHWQSRQGETLQKEGASKTFRHMEELPSLLANLR